MSSFGDAPPAQRPVEDHEFHSLSDPLGFPVAFKNWIVQYVQQELLAQQLTGYLAPSTPGISSLLNAAAFCNSTVTVPNSGALTLVPMNGFDTNQSGFTISTVGSPGGVAGRLIVPRAGTYLINCGFFGDISQNWRINIAFYTAAGASSYNESLLLTSSAGTGPSGQQWFGLRALAALGQIAIFAAQTNSAGTQAVSVGRINAIAVA